jgi:hypothetical protein
LWGAVRLFLWGAVLWGAAPIRTKPTAGTQRTVFNQIAIVQPNRHRPTKTPSSDQNAIVRPKRHRFDQTADGQYRDPQGHGVPCPKNRHRPTKTPSSDQTAIVRPNRHRPTKPPSFDKNRHRSTKTAIVRSNRHRPIKPPSFGQNRRRWFGQTQRGYGQTNGGMDTARRVPARTPKKHRELRSLRLSTIFFV